MGYEEYDLVPVRTIAIAADVTGPTVVKASAGMLGTILVTASGAGQITVYDSASAASGTIIGITPANPAVGSYYALDMPAVNGIVVSGSSTSPGVTVSYQ